VFYDRGMNKRALVQALAEKLRVAAGVAARAGAEAAVEAREGATPAEKREDARVALEYAGLARGQHERAARAMAEAAALDGFSPRPLGRADRVSLGAVVEVEGDEEGRTFFLAPVGGGVELTVPGGDGFLSVVTPSSPIGRAVLGRRVGETIEVLVAGEPREWTITYLA
jgi:transcription elongation GreA/GreB family factor